MPLFISFEGGEGAGKSTQAERLRQRLEDAGHRVIHVQEPGSTPLGTYLRDWLKGGAVGQVSRHIGTTEALSERDELELTEHGNERWAREVPAPETELFLFAAARAELVSNVIAPALREPDTIVLADRYADSTVAYQGYGRGIPLELVAVVNKLATHGVVPDLTLYLDCPPEMGLHRLGSFQLQMPLEPSTARSGSPGVSGLGVRRREQEGSRFELESLEFHQRVRAGYLEMAAREPKRWRVVDASRPVDEVDEAVWERVREAMAAHERSAVRTGGGARRKGRKRG